MINNFYLGIILLIVGLLYGAYNIKRANHRFEDEGDFGKSLIIQGVIGSFGLIIVGLYLIIKNI